MLFNLMEEPIMKSSQRIFNSFILGALTLSVAAPIVADPGPAGAGQQQRERKGFRFMDRMFGGSAERAGRAAGEGAERGIQAAVDRLEKRMGRMFEPVVGFGAMMIGLIGGLVLHKLGKDVPLAPALLGGAVLGSIPGGLMFGRWALRSDSQAQSERASLGKAAGKAADTAAEAAEDAAHDIRRAQKKIKKAKGFFKGAYEFFKGLFGEEEEEEGEPARDPA